MGEGSDHSRCLALTTNAEPQLLQSAWEPFAHFSDTGACIRAADDAIVTPLSVRTTDESCGNSLIGPDNMAGIGIDGVYSDNIIRSPRWRCQRGAVGRECAWSIATFFA